MEAETVKGFRFFVSIWPCDPDESKAPMEKSSFFNSVNGDRKYNAADWAAYFAGLVGNGVFGSPADGLKVVPDTNTQIALQPGAAWINGYFYSNTAKMVIELPAPNGVLNRIDRIVIRWSLNDRTMKAAIKSSPLASSPVVPVLQRDGSVWELAVADVFVAAGATSITENNITDQRGNENLCGTVSSIVSETHTHDNATQTKPGFMSAADKKALDGVAAKLTQDVGITANVTFKQVTADRIIGAVYA